MLTLFFDFLWTLKEGWENMIFFLFSSLISLFNFFNYINWVHLKYFLFYLVNSLFIFVFVLLAVALFTVFERKTMAALQKRKGPNVHGFLGFLQAFADGLKLFLKEDVALKVSSLFIFRASPIFSLFIAFISWSVIPFCYFCGIYSTQMGVLLVLAFSSLFVYGIILGGWSSNSTYAFLGALRSTAQMISYEVSMAFILLTLALFVQSLDLVMFQSLQLMLYLAVPFFFLATIFLICLVAETNRAPFDLPEAEAELVSGYNVEYGGMSFAFFFLAEYCSIILMVTFFVILLLGAGWPFLGSWFGEWSYYYGFSDIPHQFTEIYYTIYFVVALAIKVQLILFFLVWIRVAFPRYRYDQLMLLGWNFILPTVLFLFELATIHALILKDIHKGPSLIARVYDISRASVIKDKTNSIFLSLSLISNNFESIISSSHDKIKNTSILMTEVMLLLQSHYFLHHDIHFLTHFNLLKYNNPSLSHHSVIYSSAENNTLAFVKNILLTQVHLIYLFKKTFLLNYDLIYISECNHIIVFKNLYYISLFSPYFSYFQFLQQFHYIFTVKRFRPQLYYVYFPHMMNPFIVPNNYFSQGYLSSETFVYFMYRFFLLTQASHNKSYLVEGLNYNIFLVPRAPENFFSLYISLEHKHTIYPWTVSVSKRTGLISHIIFHPFVVYNDRGIYQKHFDVFNREFYEFPFISDRHSPPNTYNWYSTKPYPCLKPWIEYNVYQKIQMLIDFEEEFKLRNVYALSLLKECLWIRFFKYGLYDFLPGEFSYYFFFAAHTKIFYLVKYCLHAALQLEAYKVLHSYKLFLDQYLAHRALGHHYLYDEYEVDLWMKLANDYCDALARRLPVIRFRVYAAEYCLFNLMAAHDMSYKNVDLTFKMNWHVPMPRKSILIHGNEHLKIVEYCDKIVQEMKENWPQTRRQWRRLVFWNSYFFDRADIDTPPLLPHEAYNHFTFWTRPYWHANVLFYDYPDPVYFIPAYRLYTVFPSWLDNFNDYFIVREVDKLRFWNNPSVMYDLSPYIFTHTRLKPIDDTKLLYWLWNKDKNFKTIKEIDEEDDSSSLWAYNNYFRFFSYKEDHRLNISSLSEINNYVIFYSSTSDEAPPTTEKKKAFEEEWKENLEKDFSHRWSEDIYTEFRKDEKNLKENDMSYEKLQAFKYFDENTQKELDIFETLKINNVSIPRYQLVLWQKHYFFLDYLKASLILEDFKKIEKDFVIFSHDDKFFRNLWYASIKEKIKKSPYKLDFFFIQNFMFFINSDKLNKDLNNSKNKEELLQVLVHYVRGGYLKEASLFKYPSSKALLNTAFCLSLLCDHRIRLDDVYKRAFFLDKNLNYEESAIYHVVFHQIVSCHLIWMSWFKLVELFKNLPLIDNELRVHQVSQSLRILLNKYEKIFILLSMQKNKIPFSFIYSNTSAFSYLNYLLKTDAFLYIHYLSKYMKDSNLQYLSDLVRTNTLLGNVNDASLTNYSFLDFFPDRSGETSKAAEEPIPSHQEETAQGAYPQ